jgi:hypothetical protein
MVRVCYYMTLPSSEPNPVDARDARLPSARSRGAWHPSTVKATRNRPARTRPEPPNPNHVPTSGQARRRLHDAAHPCRSRPEASPLPARSVACTAPTATHASRLQHPHYISHSHQPAYWSPLPSTRPLPSQIVLQALHDLNLPFQIEPVVESHLVTSSVTTINKAPRL